MRLFVGTAAAVFLTDILTKGLALHHLQAYAPVPVVSEFFNLSLVFNRGAAFGMFPGAAVLFMGLAAATIVILVVYSARHKDLPGVLYLAQGLICGGALGNLVDRLRWGHVVDFLDFYVGRWHWPAFNVADAALCVGAFLFVWHAMGRGRPA